MNQVSPAGGFLGPVRRSYRLQVEVSLVLLLVGVEPVDGVDVLGVGLIEVGERHHDRSALTERGREDKTEREIKKLTNETHR